jgi:hypothetical protein
MVFRNFKIDMIILSDAARCSRGQVLTGDRQKIPKKKARLEAGPDLF